MKLEQHDMIPFRANAPELQESDFRLEASPIDIDFAAAEGKEDDAKKFNCLAYTGGVMTPAWPGYPIVLNLAGMKQSGNLLAVLRDHDTRQPIGQGQLQINDNNVRVTGTLCGPEGNVGPVVQAAQRGFVWGASLGGSLGEVKYIAEGESVQVNGKTFKGPVYVAGKSNISEVSFLAIAADNRTQVKIAAMALQHGAKNMDPKFVEWLKASGFAAPESLTPEAVKTLEAAWKASQQTEETEVETPETPEPASQTPVKVQAAAGDQDNIEEVIAARRKRFAAEDERIAAIDDLATKYSFAGTAAITAKAKSEGWTADKTELALLRAKRPEAPSTHIPSKHVITNDVLLAACLQSGKLQNLEKEFSGDRIQALEAADKMFHGNMSIQQFMMEAAAANGFHSRYFRGNELATQRAAFGQLRAGGSTVDASGILSNVANKFLLEGFFSVERTWRDISSVRPVNDFKTVTSYRLIGTDQYEKVTPGGEIKHGNLGEESYTNKADTYGLMLDISRTDIINDDLGAITTVPRKLGRGSGLKINDVFWTEWLGNDGGTFWATGHSNYYADAAAVLSIASLTVVEKMFMDLKDRDGKPLGIMPAILLVSTDNSALATVLNTSAEIRDTTASTKYPVANPHQGKYTPKVGRYLNNSSYTGYSTTAWWLIANPADLSAIEVAFLNGNESPTIETADAEFNRLGIQMRGYHDFGVNLQDYAAAIMSKGAA